MVLFILFNGGDLAKSQWHSHPFENKKTTFLDKLAEIGEVYSFIIQYSTIFMHLIVKLGVTMIRSICLS